MKQTVITAFAAKNKDLKKAPAFEEVCKIHQNGILSDVLRGILFDYDIASKSYYFGVVYCNHKPVSVCVISKPKNMPPYVMACTLTAFRNKGFAIKALQVAFKKSRLAKSTKIKCFNSAMAAVIIKSGLRMAPADVIHETIGSIP